MLETNPAAGEQVPEGTTITVLFSDGPEKVPDVVGMTQEEAEQALKQAGFKAFVTTSDDTEEPKGTVIEQNPDGGEERPAGDSVTIVVSSFEEPTETARRPRRRRPRRSRPRRPRPARRAARCPRRPSRGQPSVSSGLA